MHARVVLGVGEGVSCVLMQFPIQGSTGHLVHATTYVSETQPVYIDIT